MRESIYNIFLLFENDVCSELAYRVHQYDGADESAMEFLRMKTDQDLSLATKFKLSGPFTRQQFNARSRLGDSHHLIDDLFVLVDAGPAPLFCITPVKDGVVFFNYSYTGDLDVNDVAQSLGERGYMDDWLEKYTNTSGMNLSLLIHDDYFLAIKLTFNKRLYVSAMKLLVSCIDSVAYIEYGDVPGQQPFILWLNTYADLAPLGITAAELWEMRNGILHMTNINSKKVRANKIRRISFRVGALGGTAYDQSGDVYYFDFYSLIQVFAAAQGRWVETYNVNREKFSQFVERYDETISDSRQAIYTSSGNDQ